MHSSIDVFCLRIGWLIVPYLTFYFQKYGHRYFRIAIVCDDDYHNLSQSEGSSIVVDDDGYSRKDRQL